MTTEEKTNSKPKPKAAKKVTKPKTKPKAKTKTSTVSLSKSDLETELQALLALAKSKENLTSAVAILKLIRELESNEQVSSLKAHWIDELMGMSDEELERRIEQEMAAYTSG
ncbi:MAG: hypothetical protein ACPGVN_03045 [Alphaproteobacteria bacterium]